MKPSRNNQHRKQSPGSSSPPGESTFQPTEATEALPAWVAEYLENRPAETLETLAKNVANIVANGSKTKARSEVFGVTGGRRYSEAGDAIEYLLSWGNTAA